MKIPVPHGWSSRVKINYSAAELAKRQELLQSVKNLVAEQLKRNVHSIGEESFRKTILAKTGINLTSRDIKRLLSVTRVSAFFKVEK